MESSSDQMKLGGKNGKLKVSVRSYHGAPRWVAINGETEQMNHSPPCVGPGILRFNQGDPAGNSSATSSEG
jgi:hypothetical protein